MGYLIFDIEIGFIQKAYYILDSHKTLSLEDSTHISIVSRELVCFTLTYATLNKLDIFTEDIRNVHLQALFSKKYYIIYELEFSIKNERRKVLIV